MNYDSIVALTPMLSAQKWYLFVSVPGLGHLLSY